MGDLDLWPRIEAAIRETRLSRAAAEWQWPTCHKRNCQGDHGDISFVFDLFLRAVSDSVFRELLCRATTDPDGNEPAAVVSDATAPRHRSAEEESAPSVVTHPAAEAALRMLHGAIEQLATHASTAYVSRTPLRTVTSETEDDYRVWFDDGQFVVLTCDDGVFWSVREGGVGDFWPDWTAVSRPQARALAHAILSACEDVADGAATESEGA